MIIRRTELRSIPKENVKDIYSEIGEINRYGVKILLNGEQWIIDAKTGNPAKREGYDCMEGQRGFFLWVKKGDTIRAGLDVTYASIWDRSLKETK